MDWQVLQVLETTRYVELYEGICCNPKHNAIPLSVINHVQANFNPYVTGT